VCSRITKAPHLALVLELGEPTELPSRAPARAPPYFRSSVVRQKLGQLSLVA
jgi:hypothetical protein